MQRDQPLALVVAPRAESLAAAVELVAQERMSAAGALHANLVRAARFERDFQQRLARSSRCNDPVVQNRMFDPAGSAGSTTMRPRLAIDFLEVIGPGRFVRLHVAGDERPVGLFDQPAFELLGDLAGRPASSWQTRSRPTRAGQGGAARRDRLRPAAPSRSLRSRLMRNSRLSMPSGACVSRPARLGDDEAGGVFVQDVEAGRHAWGRRLACHSENEGTPADCRQPGCGVRFVESRQARRLPH